MSDVQQGNREKIDPSLFVKRSNVVGSGSESVLVLRLLRYPHAGPWIVHLLCCRGALRFLRLHDCFGQGGLMFLFWRGLGI